MLGETNKVLLGLEQHLNLTKISDDEPNRKEVASFTPHINRNTRFQLNKVQTFERERSFLSAGSKTNTYKNTLEIKYIGCGRVNVEGKNHAVSLIELKDAVVRQGKLLPFTRTYYVADDLGIPLAQEENGTLSSFVVKLEQ